MGALVLRSTLSEDLQAGGPYRFACVHATKKVFAVQRSHPLPRRFVLNRPQAHDYRLCPGYLERPSQTEDPLSDFDLPYSGIAGGRTAQSTPSRFIPQQFLPQSESHRFRQALRSLDGSPQRMPAPTIATGSPRSQVRGYRPACGCPILVALQTGSCLAEKIREWRCADCLPGANCTNASGLASAPIICSNSLLSS